MASNERIQPSHTAHSFCRCWGRAYLGWSAAKCVVGAPAERWAYPQTIVEGVPFADDGSYGADNRALYGRDCLLSTVSTIQGARELHPPAPQRTPMHDVCRYPAKQRADRTAAACTVPQNEQNLPDATAATCCAWARTARRHTARAHARRCLACVRARAARRGSRVLSSKFCEVQSSSARARLAFVSCVCLTFSYCLHISNLTPPLILRVFIGDLLQYPGSRLRMRRRRRIVHRRVSAS
eukprot:COSAG02_NODE_633_length_19262_cov_32.473256_5_plen_239_part_00